MAGLAVSLLCLIRVWYLVMHPDLAITNVPDDAFYYMKLAQNRLALGSWTFDGTAQTSGFHLLHAYLLVAMDFIFRPAAQDWLFVLKVVGTTASLCLGLAASLVVRSVQLTFGCSGWWALPVFVSPMAMNLSSFVMESHLVVLAAAAVWFFAGSPSRPNRLGSLGLIGLGVLAALTRSDFVVLLGVMWLVAAVFWRRDSGLRLRRVSLILGAALVGFGLTVTHTYLISHTLFQTSVSTKFRWTTSSWGGASTVFAAVSACFVLLFGLSLAYVVVKARRRVSADLLAEPISAAAWLSLLAYCAVYAWSAAGLQPWYSASVVVPAALLLAAIGGTLTTRWDRFGALLVAVVSIFALTSLTASIWPHQLGILRASQRLSEYPQVQHIGSWNAGILGVTSGITVTNLDGLVNDDAAAAGARGDILGYLRQRGIDYVVDHPATISTYQSGQGNGQLGRCMEPVAELNEPTEPLFQGEPVTLFRVLPGCS